MVAHTAWCRHSIKDYVPEVFYTNDYFLFLKILSLLLLASAFQATDHSFLQQTFYNILVRILN